jgi:hypothetical protein
MEADSSRFVQLVERRGDLYALDEAGQVWKSSGGRSG